MRGDLGPDTTTPVRGCGSPARTAATRWSSRWVPHSRTRCPASTSGVAMADPIAPAPRIVMVLIKTPLCDSQPMMRGEYHKIRGLGHGFPRFLRYPDAREGHHGNHAPRTRQRRRPAAAAARHPGVRQRGREPHRRGDRPLRVGVDHDRLPRPRGAGAPGVAATGQGGGHGRRLEPAGGLVAPPGGPGHRCQAAARRGGPGVRRDGVGDHARRLVDGPAPGPAAVAPHAADGDHQLPARRPANWRKTPASGF